MTILYTADHAPEFYLELYAIAGRLVAPRQVASVLVWSLLGVMQNESGVRSTAHNPNGDASGLIQFMPDTLRRLGWTRGTEAFRQLSAREQLPFVERYFAPYRGQLGSDAAAYVATFLPALIKHAGDTSYVLCGAQGPMAWAYSANRGFDRDGKRYITVQDLADAIGRACNGARWNEIVERMQAVIDAVAMT